MSNIKLNNNYTFETISDIITKNDINVSLIFKKGNWTVDDIITIMKSPGNTKNITLVNSTGDILEAGIDGYTVYEGITVRENQVIGSEIIDGVATDVIATVVTVNLRKKGIQEQVDALEQTVYNTFDVNTCTLDELKEYKVKKLGEACTATISSGVDVNGKHYSLTEKDQINIKALYDACATGTVDTVLYHADGEICCAVSTKEMIAIGNAATQFVTYQTTLCNHLNVWVRRCETKDEVNAIEYTSTLPDDLLEHFKRLKAEIR